MSHAAQRLNLAQPALSRQIQDLERELGVALFGRVKRRLSLTPAGAEFLRHARALLERADDAVRSAQRVAGTLAGELRVGFVEAAMLTGVLPEALARLAQRAPQARVELHEESCLAQLAGLRARRLDVALLHAPPDLAKDGGAADGLAVEALWTDALVPIIPAAHPAVVGRGARPTIDLEGLRDTPLVAFRQALATDRYAHLLRACSAAGYVPARVQEVDQFRTVASLVAGGVGVGFVPRSMRSALPVGVVEPALREAAGGPFDVPLVLHLVTRRADVAPVVSALLGEVRAVLATREQPRPGTPVGTPAGPVSATDDAAAASSVVLVR